ncbi:MAG: DUF479 domain-containing protein [Chitinophagaceae bacterium]|nr:DUF479 domain-containing protein [Chitinophagaceae bacterium]
MKSLFSLKELRLNYLAHAHLSFEYNEILVGNIMGDFIKGNRYNQYPQGIRQGILLHRWIDHFTDSHPIVHDALMVFRDGFRLSGGVFLDILFDHFLANDSAYFSEESLKEYTHATYSHLLAHQHHFSDDMRTFFSYMQSYDWLFHYRFKDGLERSIMGMCKRHPRLGDGTKALALIDTNYEKLRDDYIKFYPELFQAAKERMSSLESL